MVNEELIRQSLVKKFSFPEDAVIYSRARRLWIKDATSNLFDVIDYARKELGFTILCTISGVDNGPALGCIYHLARRDGIILNIGITVPKDKPAIRTLTHVFPYADIYEREIADLFGFTIEGLPEGNRYPLPDNWPRGEYPLRKDWKDPKKKEEASHAQGDNPDRASAPGA